MWCSQKEAVLPYFKKHFFLEEAEQSKEKHEDSRSPVRDENLVIFEYDTGMLTTVPWCLIQER